MKREGVKRMWAGGLLFFIVAPGIFVLAIILGVNAAINAVESAERVPPGGTVQLEAGEQVALFQYDAPGPTDALATESPDTGTEAPVTTCVVTDPTGAPAQLSRGGETEISQNGRSYDYAYDLTAGPAGPYKITCGSNSVLVMDEDLAGMAGRGALLAFIGLVVPFVVGVIGLALFIWGLVKFNSSKKRIAYGYGGYPQQQPYQDPQQQPYQDYQQPYHGYQQQPYAQPGDSGGGQSQPYAGPSGPSWGGGVDGGGSVGGSMDSGGGSSGGHSGGNDSGGSSGGGGDSSSSSSN